MYIVDRQFLTETSTSIIFPSGIRNSYSNNLSGRIQLENEVPQETFDEVLEIWGDAPTLPDPEYIESKQTLDTSLTTEELEEAMIYLYEQVEEIKEQLQTR